METSHLGSSNSGMELAPRFHSTTEIIDELKLGKPVVLCDDEARENEGDIVIAADFATPESINFMITHARGLVCLTLAEPICQRLGLAPVIKHGRHLHSTNFTDSIEAARGVTTGISASDRAATISAAIAPNSTRSDINSPGHVFPIMGRKGGVLARAGHTEASIDLSQLAGLTPAAVICEIINDDGTMARRDELHQFAAEHDLKIGTIADLIKYRVHNESTVKLLNKQEVQTDYGVFEMRMYQDTPTGTVHSALILGDIDDISNACPLVRVQTLDFVRDVMQVDLYGGWSANRALAAISEAGCGVLISLGNDARSFADFASVDESGDESGNESQNESQNESLRNVGIGTGAQILSNIGVRNFQLLAGASAYPTLSGFGLEIDKIVPYSDDSHQG